MLSFLHPTPLALQTPPELQPYGWTTTDLWCAPLITGLYALLTHAQPFWAEAHVFIINLMGGSVDFGRGHEKEVAPVDPEVARAVCAAVLSILFAARTVKNFSGPTMPSLEGAREQRSKKTLKRSRFPATFEMNVLICQSYRWEGQDPIAKTIQDQFNPHFHLLRYSTLCTARKSEYTKVLFFCLMSHHARVFPLDYNLDFRLSGYHLTSN